MASFKRPTSRKKNLTPVVAAARAIAAGGSRPPGAVPVKRTRQTQDALRTYRPQEPWFAGPLTEWVIYDDLTFRRGLRPQIDLQTGIGNWPYDFTYQQAVDNPAQARQFFRADFVFPPGSRAFQLGPDFPGGLILDPYSDLTHPVGGADIVKRAGISSTEAPALTIFLEQTALLNDPHTLIGDALRGIDRSTRGAQRT